MRFLSVLTLLVGHEEKLPGRKKLTVLMWLSGAKCTWFAYGPADATATPSSFASLKSRMVLRFWYRLTQVVLEKRPLNECYCCCYQSVLCCVGLHRYVFLLYKQSGKLNFTEPRLTNCSGGGRPSQSVSKFAAKYSLGDPIAGNFFQAEWDDYVPKLHAQLSG